MNKEKFKKTISNIGKFIVKQKFLITFIIAIFLIIAIIFLSINNFKLTKQAEKSYQFEMSVATSYIYSEFLTPELLNSLLNDQSSISGTSILFTNQNKVSYAFEYMKEHTSKLTIENLQYYYDYLYNEELENSSDISTNMINEYQFNIETRTYEKQEQEQSQIFRNPISEQNIIPESLQNGNYKIFLNGFEKDQKVEGLKELYYSISGNIVTLNNENYSPEPMPIDPISNTRIETLDDLTQENYIDNLTQIGTVKLSVCFTEDRFVITDITIYLSK